MRDSPPWCQVALHILQPTPWIVRMLFLLSRMATDSPGCSPMFSSVRHGFGPPGRSLHTLYSMQGGCT